MLMLTGSANNAFSRASLERLEKTAEYEDYNCIAYFSMNFLCCSTSAQLKKSSTSRAVGTSVAEEFCSCILSSVVLDAFVEELGVRMLSGFLIKLQGVDSLLLPSKIEVKQTLILIGL